MNSHDEQHIELADEGFDHFKWTFRIECDAGAATGVSNLLQGFQDIVFGFRFHMNSDRVCAGFDESRHIMIGTLDHQMHIQWQICFFAYESNNVRPEGNVIDEMAVHDVAMNPIGACGFDTMDLLSEPRE